LLTDVHVHRFPAELCRRDERFDRREPEQVDELEIARVASDRVVRKA
jgi:hypothetical protein